MTKSLMISIQPQHAVNILNGDKTLELRTWIPKGYVGWVYVYVTKGKPYLVNFYNELPYYAINDYTYKEILDDGNTPLNGKVAFRFWFDEYEEITLSEDLEIITSEISHELLLQKSCVDYNLLNNYFMNENGDVFGYAWHIKQLEIFDTPKELSDFKTKVNNKNGNVEAPFYVRVDKAPQRSVWVYV